MENKKRKIESRIVELAMEWKKIFCFEDGTHGYKNDEKLNSIQDKIFDEVKKLETL